MNLFKELVITAPVSARLQFGFNENIIVSAIDTEVRKTKGIPIKANTFITLSKVDPETRKVVAQNEFNFFNLDSTTDFVQRNFIEQMTALVSLIDAMGGSIETFDDALVAVLTANKQELEVFVKTKDGAKLLQDTLQNSFSTIVKDLVGANCPLMKCKLIVNKSGYLEISKVQGWILPMDSDESLPEVTAQETKVRATAASTAGQPKTAKPDELGAPPVATAEKTVAKTGFSGL